MESRQRMRHEIYGEPKFNLANLKPASGFFWRPKTSLSVICGSRHRSNQSDEPLFIYTDLENYQLPYYQSPYWRMVKRRGPNKLAELTRATIFDNLNCSCGTKGDCCKRILSEKIDQLQITETEKVMLKKFNSFCNSNNV